MKKNQNNIIVVIDTTQTKTVVVGLKVSETEIYWNNETVTIQKSQRVLPLLIALMKQRGVDWSQIAAVEVQNRPGSFTGLRVGFAIANALGYLLRVKVNGLPIGQGDFPRYDAA